MLFVFLAILLALLTVVVRKALFFGTASSVTPTTSSNSPLTHSMNDTDIVQGLLKDLDVELEEAARRSLNYPVTRAFLKGDLNKIRLKLSTYEDTDKIPVLQKVIELAKKWSRPGNTPDLYKEAFA